MKTLIYLLLLSPLFLACSTDSNESEHSNNELSVTKWVAVNGNRSYTIVFAKYECMYYEQWKDQEPFNYNLKYVFNKPNVIISNMSGGEYAKGTVNNDSMNLTIKDKGTLTFSKVPYLSQSNNN